MRQCPPPACIELTCSAPPRACGLLHPPYRSEEFYRALPGLIERIENDDIPEAQRGDYELNDSMFDWSRARRRSKVRRLWA